MADNSLKICHACGRDVSHDKRFKDAQGHYFCEPCNERLVNPVASTPSQGNRPASAKSPKAEPQPERKKIGIYELIRLLGKGGMGEVWLAHDSALRRDVALKLLPKLMLDDSGAAKRFLREARTAAQLNHPNGVTIYQVGEEDGQIYIVMELIDGGSLADELKQRGRFPWLEATKAIRDAAAGLAAAHEVGLIHRDIKPSNLMRSGRGFVKVVDFGLARAAGDGTELTRAGTVLGTPSYMSPEQGRGEQSDVRSDIYSLACTYYALVVGKPPFRGDSSAVVIYQHIHEPAPDPQKLVPDLPEGVACVIARGMAKDPTERYQTATDMITALDDVLEDSANPDMAQLSRLARTVGKDDPAVPVKVVKHSSRRHTIVAAAIVSIAVLGAALWGVWHNWFNNPATIVETPPTVKSLTTQMAAVPVTKLVLPSTLPSPAPSIPETPSTTVSSQPTAGPGPVVQNVLPPSASHDGGNTGIGEVQLRPLSEKIDNAATLQAKVTATNAVVSGTKPPLAVEGIPDATTLQAKVTAAIAEAKTLATDEDRKRFALQADDLMNAAVEMDQCDIGLQLIDITLDAAKHAGSPELRAQIMADAARLRLAQAGAVAYKNALVALQKNLSDPRANLIVGRYCCFLKGDWDTGLAALKRSSNPLLAALAEKELQQQENAAEQMAIADGWWDQSLTEDNNINKAVIQCHAADLYSLASPDLADEVAKARADAQLKAFASSGLAVPGSIQRTIDMLKLVNPPKDSINGIWTIRDAVLESDNTSFGRIEFPYQPPLEYDYKAVFTRTSGDEVIVLICNEAGHLFNFEAGAWQNTIMGFSLVNNKFSNTNPTGRHSTAWLENGRSYTCVVKVRRNKVQAFLDGNLVSEWKTDYHDMTLVQGWQINTKNAVGVGTNLSPTVFKSIEITEVSGYGRILREPGK